MLLNPSHEITLSGLPPDVLDAYVRYKKGTRAIVTWIVQYGPSTYHGAKRLPLRDLAILAEIVKNKLKHLPDVVHFHFRETIAARKRLSKYFRGNVDTTIDDFDTVNHEHFTSSLIEIYASLCACCGQPKSYCKTQKTAKQGQHELTTQDSIYHALKVEESSDSESDDDSYLSSEVSECALSEATSLSENDFDICLEDDELEKSLAIKTTLERMYDITRAIQHCWKDVGLKNISFVVAAFVTNIGFASLRELEITLRQYEDDLSMSSLIQKCKGLSSQRTLTKAEHPSCEHFLNLLETNGLTSLCQTKNICEGQQDGAAARPQKPADYILRLESGLPVIRLSELRAALFRNVIHLIHNERVPGTIVRNSTPMYADVGYLITSSDCQSEAFHTNLGLYVLSSSYEAFLLNFDKASAATSCRLSALRLAQQASSSISGIISNKSSFPCYCPQTLAYHLQNLQTDVSAFARQNCWTLYFQSPWVAGNHILEMLDLCCFYGSRLLKYRHYIGAVVHSYNALQQLAGLEEIAVLEYLCTQLRDTYFPGGLRSTSKYIASWARFTGARLKFKKGAKHRNQRDSWCMAIPAHAARNAAGLAPTDETSHSKADNSIFGIKQANYFVNEASWKELGQSKATDANSKDSSHPLNTHLLPNVIEQFNLHSPNSPLLNIFAVFKSCVEVVSTLSDATHKRSSTQGGTDDDVANCICFASTILTAADRITDARRLGRLETWRKHERECVDLTMKVLREQMGKLTVDEWGWKL